MGKARVGVRLKEAIGGSKSLNRSADLTSLTDKYNVLRKKLHALIAACKGHYSAMVNLSKARVELANRLADISKGSPLFECAGQLPAEGQAKNEVCSYASVHHALVPRTKSYTDKYGQYVINYAIEWDQVVTKRVSAGLAETEKLRRDLDHYQKKVESIRQGVNKVLASGKSVDAKQQERLSRNEEKLQTAKESYDKLATNMCILIEEVTERSWRDLHPMLVKMAQFDSTLSGDETKGLAEMSQVLYQLKQLAEKHDLKPQARLKDIETLQPSMLSTRKEPYGLAIEADSSTSLTSGSFGGMTAMGMSMPAGSVAPQGSGGFPVPVLSPSGGTEFSRSSSINSFSSAPNSGNLSTSDMMAISANAAPPPTMDQVTEATRNNLSMSGGYPPPLYPSSYNRSSSNISADSSTSGNFGGPPVAAPAAPPPPPPSAMNSLSMYPSLAPAPYPGAPAPYGAPPAVGPYGAPPSQPAVHPWSTGAPQQSPAYAGGGSSGNPFADF